MKVFTPMFIICGRNRPFCSFLVVTSMMVMIPVLHNSGAKIFAKNSYPLSSIRFLFSNSPIAFDVIMKSKSVPMMLDIVDKSDSDSMKHGATTNSTLFRSLEL